MNIKDLELPKVGWKSPTALKPEWVDAAKNLLAGQGFDYDFSEVPTTAFSNKDVVVTCLTHNKRYTSRPRRLLAGSTPCVECISQKKRQRLARSRTEVVTFLRQKDATKVLLSTCELMPDNSEVEMECQLHGKYTTTVHILYLSKGCGCPACGNAHRSSGRTKTTAWFIRQSRNRFGNRYVYSNTEYAGTQSNTTITCRVHGDFQVTPNNHLTHGHGCQQCAALDSANSSSVERQLAELYPQFVRQKSGLCATNRRWSVDLYSESHRLAVEVNGTYWHTDQFADSGKHVTKTLDLRRDGIQLLHFWDYEVSNRLDLVVSMIDSKLGLSKRLYARDLIVTPLSSIDANNFLAENHMQGRVKSSVAYGLKTVKGRMAAVMSLGRPRFNNDHDWELLRFANHKGITVVGGASRLFSAFTKAHPNESVVSYADIRYSDGNLYRQLGFKFVRRTPPNYVWCKGGDRVSRYQSQKHKLHALLGSSFDPNLSEADNMYAHKYYKLEDCGNLVYSFHP